jgi:cell division septation protein DedD
MLGLKKGSIHGTQPTIGFWKSVFGRRKMVEERRQHQRLVPNAPLFISLDDLKSGLLLDLCEGGLAVASLVPRSLDEVVVLAFDLPEGIGHVQAKAKIAWTRDAGHLTGVHFVDLDEISQQQLSEWISTGTNLRRAPLPETTDPGVVTRSTYAQVDAIRQDTWDHPTTGSERSLLETPPLGEGRREAAKSEPAAPPGRERTSKTRYSVELFLAVVVLSWALVFLGYQMGSTGTSRRNREVTAASKEAEAASTPEFASTASLPATALAASALASATARPPKRTPVPTSVAALVATSMDSGVVLQVGAMKLEDNAAAMAQELRKKKFPAVVFRHSGDRLYRVAVGPYSDVDSTAKAKGQLEKEGLKPLLLRWAKE